MHHNHIESSSSSGIKYLRSESKYHRIATLYCPDCLYLEFPGCLIHNGLLTHIKGNGYMSCLGCETDRKQSGIESDNIVTMACATDISEPWQLYKQFMLVFSLCMLFSLQLFCLRGVYCLSNCSRNQVCISMEYWI
jgi:hypothetical protein